MPCQKSSVHKMVIYVTYCSKSKDSSLRNKKVTVYPFQLYKGKKRIEPFMNACMSSMVNWAILSDKYGIWFPNEKHKWYDKSPNQVTQDELNELMEEFDTKLCMFDEIRFYHKGGRPLHKLYRGILENSRLNDRIKIVNSIKKIM